MARGEVRFVRENLVFEAGVKVCPQVLLEKLNLSCGRLLTVHQLLQALDGELGEFAGQLLES